jgi:xanthine phosphoribosyltransferase
VEKGQDMQELKDRIRKEGRVLPGNIIKVDGFLNHRVDVKLMRGIAKELARRFDTAGVTAVLTVEASGIPLGTVTAEELGVPLVFAKKAKSDNIEGGLLRSEIYSYTYKKKMTLLVSGQWLGADDRVLIVVDFLANGEALRGLVDIIDQAGAELIGMGVAVEKGFQPGGRRLREQGVNLISLAVIESADENGIVFREDD